MSVARNLLLVARKSNKCLFAAKRCLSIDKDHVVGSEFPDVQIPEVDVPQLVYSYFGRWGDKIATECSITGRKYTYDEVRSKSRNFNRALRKKLKLGRGDVIASLLPNIPEYPVVMLGALSGGLTLTTLNPLYTAEEISKQLNDSGAKAIITLTEFSKTVENAINLCKRKIPIITIKTEKTQTTPQGTINFSEFADTEIDFEDAPPNNPDDLAFLPYSSGTTGLPKGVQLTHRNIVANLAQLRKGTATAHFIEATGNHQDIVPAVLPMFHIYGLTVVTLQTMLFGSKLVTLPRFTPESYIGTLRRHLPHVLFVAPPLVLFLTAHPDVTTQLLQNVRVVTSGAAPLGGTDEERFLEKSGKKVHMLQGYGLTETSPVVTFLSADLKNKYKARGSVGAPLENTKVKVVPLDSPAGPGLGPNTSGEILVKGPQVMKGYHNRPQESKDSFCDGWLRTGDIGYYDNNNLFYITDRIKELIKVKGFQVPPAELEAVVRSHPAVNDAAVIGIPHPIYGEVPRAYVVPKSGKSLNSEELQEFVAGKVASYKQLKGGVELVPEIPKNAAGKILRRQIKLAYASQNS